MIVDNRGWLMLLSSLLSIVLRLCIPRHSPFARSSMSVLLFLSVSFPSRALPFSFNRCPGYRFLSYFVFSLSIHPCSTSSIPFVLPSQDTALFVQDVPAISQSLNEASSVLLRRFVDGYTNMILPSWVSSFRAFDWARCPEAPTSAPRQEAIATVQVSFHMSCINCLVLICRAPCRLFPVSSLCFPSLSCLSMLLIGRDVPKPQLAPHDKNCSGLILITVFPFFSPSPRFSCGVGHFSLSSPPCPLSSSPVLSLLPFISFHFFSFLSISLVSSSFRAFDWAHFCSFTRCLGLTFLFLSFLSFLFLPFSSHQPPGVHYIVFALSCCSFYPFAPAIIRPALFIPSHSWHFQALKRVEEELVLEFQLSPKEHYLPYFTHSSSLACLFSLPASLSSFSSLFIFRPWSAWRRNWLSSFSCLPKNSLQFRLLLRNSANQVCFLLVFFSLTHASPCSCSSYVFFHHHRHHHLLHHYPWHIFNHWSSYHQTSDSGDNSLLNPFASASDMAGRLGGVGGRGAAGGAPAVEGLSVDTIECFLAKKVPIYSPVQFPRASRASIYTAIAKIVFKCLIENIRSVRFSKAAAKQIQVSLLLCCFRFSFAKWCFASYLSLSFISLSFLCFLLFACLALNHFSCFLSLISFSFPCLIRLMWQHCANRFLFGCHQRISLVSSPYSKKVLRVQSIDQARMLLYENNIDSLSR